MLKGAWAAARIGKSLLPDYKRALGEDANRIRATETTTMGSHRERSSRFTRATQGRVIWIAPCSDTNVRRAVSWARELHR